MPPLLRKADAAGIAVFLPFAAGLSARFKASYNLKPEAGALHCGGACKAQFAGEAAKLLPRPARRFPL